MERMTEVPFGGRWLALDAPSARMPVEGEDDGAPSPRSKVVLRRLHRLILALVAIVVCGAVANFARERSGVVAASEVVAEATVVRAATGVEPWTSIHEPSRAWRAGVASRAVVDLGKLESDLDEKDPFWGMVEDTTLSLRRVSTPREVDWAPRGELPADPSRFAAGTHLARGPPV